MKPVITCYLCRQKIVEEHFCYGCRVHVCVKCDKTMCMGKHVPGDHLRLSYGEYHGTD